jgi:O-antigen/teichoic acid export membrane protein
LGPEGYGVYAFAFALLTLLSIPAQAGLPQLVVRETAKARANEDWQLMLGIWRWSTRFIALFSMALVLFIGGILWLGGEWIDPNRRNTLLAGLLLVPLLALGLVRGSALRGLGSVVKGQIPGNVIRPGLLIVFVLMASWIWPERAAAPQVAMLLHVLAAFAAFALATVMLRNGQPSALRKVQHPREEKVYWRRAALPLALVAGLQLINSQADLVLLGLIREDAEVGVYRVVVQMGNLVIFGLVAINQALHPHFAALYSSGDLNKLQRLVTMSARAILALALIPVALFLFAGRPILGLVFGAEYVIGAVALAILSLGQLSNVAFGSVGALLNMTGHERDTMRGMMVAIVINLVLNLALIPYFGMAGAATATAVSFLVWNAILWNYVRKRLGIQSIGVAPLRKV